MSKSYAIGVVFVLVAAISWSTAGLFTRVVTTDIPSTLFWRAIFGGACVLFIFLAVRRPKHLNEIWHFRLGEAVVALFSALGMMCFISAFFHTSIANVSFIYGAMPLVTMWQRHLMIRERRFKIQNIHKKIPCRFRNRNRAVVARAPDESVL